MRICVNKILIEIWTALRLLVNHVENVFPITFQVKNQGRAVGSDTTERFKNERNVLLLVQEQ